VLPDTPAWWYEGRPTALAKLLRPLGTCYGWLAERRLRLIPPYRSRLPVICIGNFTAGGTGKTPLALRLADELIRLGERPCFLTRGYGGRVQGPHWVAAEKDDPRDIGDEAFLLAERAPTVVAANRAAGARAIEAAGHGFTVIVMDDGLQNPHLAKDLKIAVVDAARGLGNGEVIPAGPLRAPLAFQLAIVDAIVVNGSLAPDAPQARLLEELKQRFPGPVIEIAPRPKGDTSWLEGTRVVAYAGIGHPGRFFTLLGRLGADVRAAEAFADHHPYSEADARRLLELAASHQALLVTTAKDWVRLAKADGARRRLQEESRVLAIEIGCDRREYERLSALATAALAGRRQVPAAG
jgi:tetraacyldisaccharide 4'-kinase